MSGETHGRVSPHVLFALAGIQAGVLGGIVMVAWLALSSALLGRSPWILPNLAASVLYRRAVLWGGFGMPTLAGIAVVVMLAGVIGLAFAMLIGAYANRARVVLLAILAGLVWYYFSHALFWDRLGVLAGIHVSPLATMSGHLLYGLVLGQYPRRLDVLRRQFWEGTAGTVMPGESETAAAPDAEDTPGTPPGSMIE
ncbi:MAG TPA: hypothetical protein VN428_21885 [Bryobacteraceae bacterium]|nr:hypothetical protein [Bryobacteraceae bacterium]